MRDRRLAWCLPVLAGVVLFSGASGGVAYAQERGGPGPGPGFGGPPPGGGPRSANVAEIPVSVLSTGLKLTAAQKTKIANVQKQLHQKREKLMPRPGGRPGEGGGPPPDFSQIRTLEQSAIHDIQTVLTADQKRVLPALIQQVEMLRSVGIPSEVYGSLNLNASQKAKLAAIAQKARQQQRSNLTTARQNGDFEAIRLAMEKSREQTHTQAMAVLTAEQRKAVTTYIQSHPRPQRGGFGGPGGPGGFGGPGGPPNL